MSTAYINHFGSYLLEQNLSFNTIQSYDYSVKQFYKLFPPAHTGQSSRL
mgnify:CR=1 FL=1